MRRAIAAGLLVAACSSDGPGAPPPAEKTSCSVLACPEPAFVLPTATGFENQASTDATKLDGAKPTHRARDLILAANEPGFAVAAFGYAPDGAIETPIADEAVDVYVLAGCTGAWQLVGSARTSTAPVDFPPIAGEGNARAMVSVPLPDLPVGLSAIRFVLRGDASTVDASALVVAPGEAFFVSDVDGTLTDGELADFDAELDGKLPDANPHAAEALAILAKRGYVPIYLTARAFAETERTRAFLSAQGFPLGLVRTTGGSTGLTGPDAAAFKTAELALYAREGVVPAIAFGNTPTDAQAYENAGIDPAERYFFQTDDGATFGGSRVDDYAALEPAFSALPLSCR